MKITKIKIINYRLLQDFELDLEKNLSLVIGKNNCGKTSLLSVLDKFLSDKLNTKDFTSDDFNIDFQKELKNIIESDENIEIPFLGISLKLFIVYDETDDLSNLSKVIMDLDPDNKTVVLGFEYSLNPDDLPKFKSVFKEFEKEQISKIEKYFIKKEKDSTTREQKALFKDQKKQKIKSLFYDFFKKYHKTYFKPSRKTIHFNTETNVEDDSNFIDLTTENIQLDKIINLKIINARRDVSNKETDKTLSLLSSKYYEKREGLENESEAIQKFKDTLTETDAQLDEVYGRLFKNIIQKVEMFGGIKKGDSIIKVISTLQHKELLKGNTTVMYDHNDEHSLPEHYNGLGYMNLIGIIFEIEVLLTDFRKDNKENEKPSDINLLFIEEPEAHTHPQMQYVFIKNIKDILKEASKGEIGVNHSFDLQTIITTHSSHITADSDFDDIKYFSKETSNKVIAKNLKDLKKEYAKDSTQYDFLKQYLTINRTELFFADKVVLIEGDTERLLLTTMMKKLDIENKSDVNLPLLSQNISVIEVGAHSQIFEKLIHFLNIKTVIITDIDTYRLEQSRDRFGNLRENADGTPKMIRAKSRVADAVDYGNNAIRLFFNEITFDTLKLLKANETICSKVEGKWKLDKEGNVYVAFQSIEGTYHARSYEDAFISLNLDFIKNNIDKFRGLKNIDDIDDYDSYDIAENCILKKTSFALDILFASDESYTNWQIPSYIKESLLWLRK